MVSWIAVAVVTMICCGVYFGVFFYGNSLEKKGVALFEETNFEDFGILAAGGLTEDDADKISDTEGVIGTEAGFYFTDSVLIFPDGRENSTVTTVCDRISIPKLIEGTLPVRENECALTSDAMKRHGMALGDTVELIPASDVPDGLIRCDEFRITARIEHAEGIRTVYDNFIFLPAEAFDTDRTYGHYNYIRVDADVPGEVRVLSQEYDDRLMPVINSCRDQLEDMSGSGTVILTRTAKEGYSTFRTDIRIIYALAAIFVAIFMVIGAIVAFSTITIMIDNSRKRLGVMKAYGFRDHEIIAQFLFYGESAVCLGVALSVVLAAVLQFVIRLVIGTMFCVTADRFAFFWPQSIVLIVTEIVMTGIVTVIVTMINVSSASAVALLNGISKKKPPGEKAVTGETAHIYPRLIMRNMKNELARVLTSVVIIGGSTLLMGLGITLRSSLDGMMPASAARINHYSLEASVSSGYDEDRIRELTDRLDEIGVEYTRVQMQNTVYGYGDREEYTTIVCGGEDIYPGYIELTAVDGKESFIPSGTDVLVDCRLAERRGIAEGDTIELYDNDLHTHSVRVTGVCQNYSPRRIYLSEDAYEAVFGSRPENNTVLIRVDEDEVDELVKELQEDFPDLDLTYSDRLPGAFDPMSRMFHVIVYILTVLAVVMAIFVLMNLVNIFVKRRQNEMIIMSVNGFYRREQIWYLLLETLVTTGLGLLLGVIMGCAMTGMVVRTVEVEEAMFVRDIDVIAWVCAVALEALFALAINLVVFRQTRKLKITDISK